MRRAVLAPAFLLVAGLAQASSFDRTPVLLVPGYGGAAGSFANMRSYLIAHGYPAEFVRAIDLVPGDGPNQAAAELQIAPAVESLLADVNAFLAGAGYTGFPKDKVAILGWSMGAASSRWYTAKVAPERVERWIGLAGANHGTQCACDRSCGIPAPVSHPNGLDDLCPPFAAAGGPAVQLGLNGVPGGDVDETPYGYGADGPGKATVADEAGRAIFYFTVRAGNETYITPNASAEIDGAGGTPVVLPSGSPAQETSQGNYLLPGEDHISIGLTSTDAFALVLALLEAQYTYPTCGDGVRTIGEQCDNGAANGYGRSCCSDWCTVIPAGYTCRSGGADVCDLVEECDGAHAECPPDLRLPDGDGDGLCDQYDLCTNVGGGRTFLSSAPVPRLVLSRVADSIDGHDGLRLSASFDLPPSTSFADLDPRFRGTHLVLLDATGETIAYHDLPPYSYSRGSFGWRLSASGKTWQYLDSLAIPFFQIKSLKLVDKSNVAPGRIRVDAVAKDAFYPIVRGREPVKLILTFGDGSDGAAGRCTESAFTAADCAYSGPTLTCKKR